MPLNFSSLPPHIRLQVAEKLKLDDAAVFEQSSKVSRKAIQHVKTPFAPMTVSIAHLYDNKEVSVCFNRNKQPRNISEMPSLRFAAKRVTIKYVFTQIFCEKLLDFVRRTGTTFEKLNATAWRQRSLCSPVSFYDLLRAANVKSLVVDGKLPTEYITNLPKNVTKINAHSEVDDDDLKKINAFDIYIGCCKIGSLGLNSVLKEWFEGKRILKRLCIHSESEIVSDDVLNGIPFSYTHDGNIFKLNNGNQILHIMIGDRGYVSVF